MPLLNSICVVFSASRILPRVHWISNLKITEHLCWITSHSQVLGLLVLLNWRSWLEGQKRNLLQPRSSSAAWEPTWCIVVRLEPDRYEPHFYNSQITNGMFTAVLIKGRCDRLVPGCQNLQQHASGHRNDRDRGDNELGNPVQKRHEISAVLQLYAALLTRQCSSPTGSVSIPSCWPRSWTWARVGAGPVTPITLCLESWKESHLGITTRGASAPSSWLRSAPRPRLGFLFPESGIWVNFYGW